MTDWARRMIGAFGIKAPVGRLRTNRFRGAR